MEIEYRSLDDLLPYVNNPKEHPDDQVQKIASSIKKFGFRIPLLVREDGEVIAGHGRILAVEELEGTLDDLLDEIEEGTQRYRTLKHVNKGEVPVIPTTDLTEAQVSAFRIADNKVAESGWDEDLLSTEIDELLEEDFDIDVLGFEEEEIDDLLDSTLSGEGEYTEGDLETDLEAEFEVVVEADTEEEQEEIYNELVEKYGEEKCRILTL